MDARTKGNWASRLGPTARTTLIVVAMIFGMLAVGMVGGFGYAIIEDGKLPTKPLVWLILATMIGLVAAAGWVLLSLYRSLHPERMSRFDRRYWKMWAVIIGLSAIVGMAVAILGVSDQSDGLSLVISNAPISSSLAIVASILITVLLVLAAIYYHRTVDDHEERAYLWGSTIGYYFLVIAFPLYWLLARGSLVPTLTIGIALLIVLVSCIVQVVVWALFKFR